MPCAPNSSWWPGTSGPPHLAGIPATSRLGRSGGDGGALGRDLLDEIRVHMAALRRCHRANGGYLPGF